MVYLDDKKMENLCIIITLLIHLKDGILVDSVRTKMEITAAALAYKMTN
jgi:hypothetical protein